LGKPYLPAVNILNLGQQRCGLRLPVYTPATRQQCRLFRVRRGRKKKLKVVEEKEATRRWSGRRRPAGRYRSVQTQTVVRDGETQTGSCALETTTVVGTTSELLGIAFSAHGPPSTRRILVTLMGSRARLRHGRWSATVHPHSAPGSNLLPFPLPSPRLPLRGPSRSSFPVAAIQVVQVVRRTRAHDPWGPTSEDQIAIFFKLISSVSHVAAGRLGL